MNTEELESYMELTREELDAAYNSILNIKNMCEDYTLKKPLKIPRLSWIEANESEEEVKRFYDVIPTLKVFFEANYDGDNLLARAIVKKLKEDKRLQDKKVYDAIEECLKMTKESSEVNKTHWSAYFLNLQKIVQEIWNSGSLVGCGRGSGVGFILLYMLGITQINPVWESTQTLPWRFLNPARVSVLDVDVDTEGNRREQVLSHLRKVYGEDYVSNVATFGTEKAKSAILTAARGLGIDVDIAQYLSSMIQSDRGIQRSLAQTFYGDEDEGFLPNKQFVHEMAHNYPELWEVAQKIEGLVNRLGSHAGGVIFVDEPFTNCTSLMRAPNGNLITAFELHDAEKVNLIKYDILSVEALDKIHTCLDLLLEQGYIEDKGNLKDTYESVVGIYNLERKNHKMWEMVWNHEIPSLFQMEKQSGIQGIALVHPESVDDLATLNSVIRLMAQEKGGEIPTSKFARFKNNINLWYEEMDKWGLTKEEQKVLEPILKISYGICESQEGFMRLVQLPECGGFDLTWSDRLRKSIAKKNPAEFEKLEEEYYQNIKDKNLSYNLCNYVWKVLVSMSKGYGFNKSHTLAYSLIGLQEMNLAYRFPLIFWNCACLISDSGGAEIEEEEEDIFVENIEYTDCIEEFTEESEDEEEEIEEVETISKKKKTRTANFGKIATAIGKMKAVGVEVAPPDINKSTFTFSPDPKTNTIRYGLSGITRVGEDLISSIIENRPYSSIEDFLKKNKVNKNQMVNLIKSGAFDSFKESRELVMKDYITLESSPKKRITLQNMRVLIEGNYLPEELNFNIKVYNFNKYLKKFKDNNYYLLDEIAMKFFDKNFDIDNLTTCDEEGFSFKIKQTIWDKIYKKYMAPVRTYVQENQQQLLDKINQSQIDELWNKYCLGSLSKWEMDSVSYYSHPHELSKVNTFKYHFSDYFDMPENPEIDRIIEIKGKQIPLFKIKRIIGTVLDRDKNKKTVTLLTTSGVVTVKIYGDVYSHYDRRISQKDLNTGKKKVLEKSWFSRGNKIIVTGIRRGDEFLGKKYASTPYHLVELITDVLDNGDIVIQHERYGELEN